MVETDRKVLIERLDAEQCSCVIYNEGETRLFWERGVQDLYRLLKTEPDFLRGAFIADKVIGKAAAALMALGGVDEVFARVISSPARELLERSGIKVDCLSEVPHIINRTRTGWCPLETRCFRMHTAEECLQQIEDFIHTMNNVTK
ncbi:MAG: TonB-dependent receptor [Butyricimonas synergistica]|nr:MAG: TonB-dependent receptor [Butyricimonas synergistica]